MGTINRPIISKSMMSDLPRACKADREIRKSKNPEVGRFEKSLDVILYAVENENRRLVVPQGKLRQALMHGAHDAFFGREHLDFNKAYERLRQVVTWPEMCSKLKAYVRSCDLCKRNKTSNQKPICLLKPLEFPTERFEQVSMDFIITLPVIKENHDVVTVIVDKITKLVMFIPTRPILIQWRLRRSSSIIGVYVDGLAYQRK
jgi:hypothetical protein